jgi:hypothetical protein
VTRSPGIARRAARPIYIESQIHASMDRVWQLTQNPGAHSRWDIRFSRITPIAPLRGGGTRFRYERAYPGGLIAGTGTTIGERDRPDGTRTSALRFEPDSVISPLGAGRGYWRYRPRGGAVTFSTGYDYEPAWGRLPDALVRPLIGWATAWSFDRLRIWAESGVPPERWPLRSVLWFWRSDRPRAARCTRRAPGGRVMEQAPSTLRDLERP